MSFAKLLTKSEPKRQFAVLLRAAGSVGTVEKSVPSYGTLLSGVKKASTLSYAELHPKYQAGTPGGKGGEFMPKGSADYHAAIHDATVHAKALVNHLANGGKDNDSGAKAIAKLVGDHAKAAADKGVNPEHIAQELTDAGLDQWKKKKLGLSLTGKEKEFTDKAMAAAYKTYNKKMADKKLDEHKKHLADAEAFKLTHGENSKEYKVSLSKANKAAAKAMEYGKEPAVVAQAPIEVAHVNTEAKEDKKKALYNAALISAKNSHLGIQDDNHDDVHVKAYAAAKAHFNDDELKDIQDGAIAENNAKVAKGIKNLAEAKANHAKQQPGKDAPHGSASHGAYKSAAADYQHHYNAGAIEHGLNAADKSAAVQQGYALHNAAKHGVQVIATPEVAHTEAPAQKVVAAALNHTTDPHGYGQITDQAGMAKAVYDAYWDHAKLYHNPNALTAIVSAADKKRKVTYDAFKDKLPHYHLHAALNKGHNDGQDGKYDPYKSTEVAPVSAAPAAAPVTTPVAPVAAVVEPATKPADSYAEHLASLDTPSKIKNAIYSAAHALAIHDKNGGQFTSPEADKLQATLMSVSAHAKSKGLLDADIKVLAKGGSDDAEVGTHKLPYKAKSKNKSKLPLAAQTAAALAATASTASAHNDSPGLVSPEEHAILQSITPHQVPEPPAEVHVPPSLTTSLAATPKSKKKVKEKPMYSPLPTGTDDDPHGVKQLDTKEKVKNAFYAGCMKLMQAKKRGLPDMVQEAQAMANAYHAKAGAILGWVARKNLQKRVMKDFHNGIYKLPNAPTKHQFEIKPNATSIQTATDHISPYGTHPLASHADVASASDHPSLAQAKKDMYDSAYKFSALANQKGAVDSAALNKGAKDIAEANTALTSKIGLAASNAIQQKGIEQYHKDNGTVPASQGLSAAPANASQAASQAAPTHVASLTTMPTEKAEAEDLNKTLAKNYYTLRKMHGNKDHPEVKAAYAEWDKLKDHMKQSMSYPSSYFVNTNTTYSNEVTAAHNAVLHEKAKQIASATTGYKSVSESYHAQALLKGSSHPDVIAAKAGLDAAATAAGSYISPNDIAAIDSVSRMNATTNLGNKKKEALTDIGNAAYAMHMAELDGGKNSQEHIKAFNNLTNVAAAHVLAGFADAAGQSTANAEAKVKATADFKDAKALKEALGNPSAITATYDAKAANFAYASGDLKIKAKKIGQDIFDALSPDVKAGLKSYTGSGYTRMNQSLINGTANASVQAVAKVLDNSLGIDMKVRRNMPQKWFFKAFGLAHNDSSRADMSKLTQAQLDSVIGKTYNEPSISSTTYNEHSNIMYSNTGGASGGIALKIRAGKGVAKGIFIDTNSNCSSEQEVILQKGATYVIRSIKKLDNGMGKIAYEAEVDLIGHYSPKNT